MNTQFTGVERRQRGRIDLMIVLVGGAFAYLGLKATRLLRKPTRRG